jgi:hypothetical protein
MRTLPLFATLSTTAATAACSGSGTTDAGSAMAECALHDDVQMYVVGLEVMGQKGLMDFQLMDAMPAPPARNNNTWMVQITATGASSGSGSGSSVAPGTLIADANINATPFMPDHGHGTSIEVIVTNEGSGQYQLSPVNLWMPGYWVTTLSVSSATVGGDIGQYKFCILQ